MPLAFRSAACVVLLSFPLVVTGCGSRTDGARSTASGSPGADFPANVRTDLRLDAVLTAEERVLKEPGNAEARLALAKACAESEDPAGAALALFPLAEKATGPGFIAPYVEYCLQLHWLEEAEQTLERLNPAPAGLQIRLAGALVEHGEGAGASTWLKKAEKTGPVREEWFDGALVWFRARNPREGLRWIERGLRTHPATGSVLTLQARCRLAQRDFAGALNALDRVPADADPDVDREYLRGRAELRLPSGAGRQRGYQRLMALARNGSGHPAAAFEAGRRALAAWDADATIDLVSRALAGGYQEVLAFEYLARAYALADRQAERFHLQGKAQMARWQLAAAQASFRRAAELRPDRPAVHLDLARSLSADGKLRDALQVVTGVEERFRDNMDLALLKAALLGRLEQVGEQAEVLKAASGWGGARANEPLGELGKNYHDSQQFDLARASLERAVALEPGDAYSHLYLGLTYARNTEAPDQARKAVFHLLRAGKASPDYFFPWMNAGSVLQRLEHLPEAAAAYRRAIDGDSRWEGPYPSLAQVLHKQGRPVERKLLLRVYSGVRLRDARRTQLENRVHQAPTDPAARFALGDRHLRDGRAREALQELVIAASLKPSWKEAQQRLADACALLGYDTMQEEAERAAR